MKVLFALIMISLSSNIFAQLATDELQAKSLKLNCRTTDDVEIADADKDGRLYLKANLTSGGLENAQFYIQQTSMWTAPYNSFPSSLRTQTLTINGTSFYEFAKYSDERYSFYLLGMPNPSSLGNRTDSFTAKVQVARLYASGPAIMYKLRCAANRD